MERMGDRQVVGSGRITTSRGLDSSVFATSGEWRPRVVLVVEVGGAGRDSGGTCRQMGMDMEPSQCIQGCMGSSAVKAVVVVVAAMMPGGLVGAMAGLELWEKA